MEKVAIVTDSNSGITQAQAKELGVFVLSMPFNIGDSSYFEGVDLTREEFYAFLKEDVVVSTSQPSPESIMDLWNEILEDYDKIVFIPMSSGLSSTCQTGILLTYEEEFENKVFVVDNQRISLTQRQSVLDAKIMADKGMTAKEISDLLLKMKFDSSIYIMVDTLHYLKKGGRITPAAAMVGSVLKIKPVLQIKGEKLDAFAKVTTIKQARSVMISQLRKDIDTRFGGQDNVWISVAHTQNEDAAMVLKEEMQKEFQGAKIYVDHLSLSISCHIGPGSLAVACAKKIEV